MRTNPIDIALQLLPCPFCNAPAGKATKKATLLPSRWKVSCSDDGCGAHYGYWSPDEWNRRAQKAEPAPAQDEREAFEERWAIRGTDDDGNLGRKPLRSLVDPQRYRGDAVNGSWVWFQRGAAWQRTRPAQAEQQPEQSGCVPEDICRRLLFAFGLECNSIGLQGAAENLHKGMKAATSALPATPSPAMDAKEE